MRVFKWLTLTLLSTAFLTPVLSAEDAKLRYSPLYDGGMPSGSAVWIIAQIESGAKTNSKKNLKHECERRFRCL